MQNNKLFFIVSMWRDRYASFFAISSAIFGSVLDNANRINRFRAFGSMASSAKNV